MDASQKPVFFELFPVRACINGNYEGHATGRLVERRERPR